jgi:hypothetical protein
VSKSVTAAVSGNVSPQANTSTNGS